MPLSQATSFNPTSWSVWPAQSSTCTPHVGELPAEVVELAAPPVVVVAPLPAVVVAALVVVGALAVVVLAPLPAEELLVEVAKVVEVLKVGLAGQVGSSMTTLTVSNAVHTVFNSPALMAV